MIPTRHHVVVTGTGRAGTTFLVQLLTALEVDTGFEAEHLAVPLNNPGRAGAELDITASDAPYVVKSPHLSFQLKNILEEHPQIVIDHAIVPMRSLFAAAESRRYVYHATGQMHIAGGLWKTESALEQEHVLLSAVYELMLTLAEYAIPVSLLFFPRIVEDPEYLYDRLNPIFEFNDDQRFLEAFNATSRPLLVHSF